MASEKLRHFMVWAVTNISSENLCLRLIFFPACLYYSFSTIISIFPPFFTFLYKNQRTNGPVNAHLISWPSKAQNIQNLENIWQRNDLDLQYSHTFIISISCLHLPTFRSHAAIVSEKSTVFTFSHRKA